MNSIIVYRSMTEQRVDEFVNSGDFFPIFVGLFVFVLLFALIQNYVVEKYTRKYFRWDNSTPTVINAVVSLALTFAVVHWIL